MDPPGRAEPACRQRNDHAGVCHLVRSIGGNRKRFRAETLVAVAVVMLQTEHAIALMILRLLEAKALFRGNSAVGRGPPLHSVDVPLALDEVVRLMPGQLA
jgi:hypothetical protein